jgi:hypothetical protein
VSLLKSAFLFWLCLLTLESQAKDSLGMMPSIRALGMGNAYIGVVDDLDSLFYNPAGLAKVRGIQVEAVQANVSAKNLTDYKDIQNIKGSSNLAQSLEPLYGKNYYAGAGARAGVAIPLFGAAVYDVANLNLGVHNPAYTQLDVNMLDDYGYALGFGIPIGPFMQFGVEGRRVKRTGSQNIYTGASFANLTTTTLQSDITQWGLGYAMDVGMNFIIPSPLVSLDIAASWQNVGNTTYITSSTAHIPTDPANLTVGFAARIDLPLITIRPAVDYRHLTEENYQVMRKLNFGVEVELPLIDIRAGFSEGYYAWGLGVGFGLLNVDVASYGVELGDYPGQIQDRRYMAQVSIDLDIGSFHVSGDGTKKSMDSGQEAAGSDGTSGSSSSNSSIWGGSHKLKERR